MTPMSDKTARKLERKLRQQQNGLEVPSVDTVVRANLSVKIKSGLTEEAARLVLTHVVSKMLPSMQLMLFRINNAGKRLLENFSYNKSNGVAVIYGSWITKK